MKRFYLLWETERAKAIEAFWRTVNTGCPHGCTVWTSYSTLGKGEEQITTCNLLRR